jgi:DNA (cytosine-5)-methyltransferase 1
MIAYYNEIDPFAAQWIRNLMDAGEIAPGEVDERSIVDVRPDDLRGYAQCHFFAGVAGWSRALRLAGWDDERPVWTGSCPCQPFSVAGKREGTADERHLWPAFFDLIRQCRPVAVFGEQVGGKDGIDWLDAVHADLEGADYRVGATVLPACSVGAPHKRERIWFVADTRCTVDERRSRSRETSSSTGAPEGEAQQRQWCGASAGPGRAPINLADADATKWGPDGSRGNDGNGEATGREESASDAERCGEPGGMADAIPGDGDGRQLLRPGEGSGANSGGTSGISEGSSHAGPVNGFWADAEWLPCRDNKYRAVEPGLKPLSPSIPRSLGHSKSELRRLARRARSNRVGRLKGYGNAIVPEVAAEFIRAYEEVA